MYCKRRLFHGFCFGWVRMTCQGNVFCTCTKLHCRRCLGNHVARVNTNDVNAKNAVRFLVRQDLHEAFGLLVRLGAAVRREWKLAGVIFDACFL